MEKPPTVTVGGYQPHDAVRRSVEQAGGDPLPSDRLSEVGELLGAVTFDQVVPVVEGFEVHLDDICAGVVDPHVLDSNHHY